MYFHSWIDKQSRSYRLSVEDQSFQIALGNWLPSIYIHDYAHGASDHDLGLHVGGFGIGIYASLKHPWLRSKRTGALEYTDISWSLSVHHWSLWWNLGTPLDSWDSRTPRWRNGSFDFLEALIGKRKAEINRSEGVKIIVPMPERDYDAIARNKEVAISWSRWPFSKSYKKIEIEFDKKNRIPFPGKGENSWDCGDDCLQMTTELTEDIEVAIENTIDYVTTQRLKHGGENWEPSEDWAIKLFRGENSGDSAQIDSPTQA